MIGLLRRIAPEVARDLEPALAQFASFVVGDELYAIDIMRIKEIVHPHRVKPIPRAPAFIEGVFELRGAILPLVDLRPRFDLPRVPVSRATKYILVAIDPVATPVVATGAVPAAAAAPRQVVGLIVDRVCEVVRVPQSALRSPPPMAQAVGAPYWQAVFQQRDRLVLVLDLAALLSSDERSSLDRLAGRPPSPGGP